MIATMKPLMAGWIITVAAMTTRLTTLSTAEPTASRHRLSPPPPPNPTDPTTSPLTGLATPPSSGRVRRQSAAAKEALGDTFRRIVHWPEPVADAKPSPSNTKFKEQQASEREAQRARRQEEMRQREAQVLLHASPPVT